MTDTGLPNLIWYSICHERINGLDLYMQDAHNSSRLRAVQVNHGDGELDYVSFDPVPELFRSLHVRVSATIEISRHGPGPLARTCWFVWRGLHFYGHEICIRVHDSRTSPIVILRREETHK